uniref:Uncharacterized protein n=1 Tax=Anopheles minimus TaxID=112268 RepID=A0A182WNM7_9DIPT
MASCPCAPRDSSGSFRTTVSAYFGTHGAYKIPPPSIQNLITRAPHHTLALSVVITNCLVSCVLCCGSVFKNYSCNNQKKHGQWKRIVKKGFRNISVRELQWIRFVM